MLDVTPKYELQAVSVMWDSLPRRGNRVETVVSNSWLGVPGHPQLGILVSLFPLFPYLFINYLPLFPYSVPTLFPVRSNCQSVGSQKRSPRVADLDLSCFVGFHLACLRHLATVW